MTRAQTHDAGLQGDHHDRISQGVVLDPSTSLAQGQNFGVGREVVLKYGSVLAPSQNLPSAVNDQRAHAHARPFV
jgi:hypothetical protein